MHVLQIKYGGAHLHLSKFQGNSNQTH